MHTMLFQGLNVYGRVSLRHYFAENIRTIVTKRHCHNARDKFCRHYESKTGFLHGQIVSKMAQNRGISAAHTCTTSIGSVCPWCSYNIGVKLSVVHYLGSVS